LTKFVVARVDEFDANTRRIVRVGGREIGVFRLDGDRFYAVRNRCPHQGGPLCVGRVVPRIFASGPGVVEVDEQAPLLVCPWHGWQYDMASGEAYAPGDPGVKSYNVTVEPGSAVAPFVAETFPVYVEEEYVVVDA
jgi:3-phenylpropionate/trans-cinnamate dioxygenase ferredoxin subunit